MRGIGGAASDGRELQELALFCPVEGEVWYAAQAFRGQAKRLPALKDRLGDVRGEMRKREHAADGPLAKAFDLG